MDKKTFQDLYSEVQEMTGDTNTTTLAYIKKWINQGQRLFNAASKRYFLREEKSANLVANQQYYQLPVDCIRVKNVKVETTSEPRPVTEIQSEEEWDRMNMYSSTATDPTHFFIRGSKEIGLYPTPSTAYTSGLIISYEKGEKSMTQADYTTGTITVTNGDATITHSATGFTASMVDRYFQVTDGSEGYFYKIASYTDTANLELENVYQGSSGSAKTFRIGESSQIPDEFHESLIDYALYRYYLSKKDLGSAGEFKSLFEAALERCKENYSAKTSSAVIHSNRVSNNSFYQIDSVT
jgi:hypothetical protein